MSAKKPWFKALIWWAIEPQQDAQEFTVTRDKWGTQHKRVKVIDARELTAEKAVERVLQRAHDLDRFSAVNVGYYAEAAGMTATVKNGKVKVRRVNR